MPSGRACTWNRPIHWAVTRYTQYTHRKHCTKWPTRNITNEWINQIETDIGSTMFIMLNSYFYWIGHNNSTSTSQPAAAAVAMVTITIIIHSHTTHTHITHLHQVPFNDIRIRYRRTASCTTCFLMATYGRRQKFGKQSMFVDLCCVARWSARLNHGQQSCSAGVVTKLSWIALCNALSCLMREITWLHNFN